jgi:hypothetical protein
MKREHRYRITVEHLAAPRPEAPLHLPLSFETGNHDEILAIVERARAKGAFDPDTAASLALGLKLFSEVLLKNKDHPVFDGLHEPLRAFIGRFKALGQDGSP